MGAGTAHGRGGGSISPECHCAEAHQKGMPSRLAMGGIGWWAPSLWAKE